jgi:hypothetical protein
METRTSRGGRRARWPLYVDVGIVGRTMGAIDAPDLRDVSVSRLGAGTSHDVREIVLRGHVFGTNTKTRSRRAADARPLCQSVAPIRKGAAF